MQEAPQAHQVYLDSRRALPEPGAVRPELAQEFVAPVGPVEESLAEASTAENQLRMMLTVCQPQLSEETQVTLILKFLCGFASSEIVAGRALTTISMMSVSGTS